jgi:hypothetical protein
MPSTCCTNGGVPTREARLQIRYFVRWFVYFLFVLDYYAHSPNFSAFVTPRSENIINQFFQSKSPGAILARSSGYGTRVLLTIGMSISLE